MSLSQNSLSKTSRHSMQWLLPAVLLVLSAMPASAQNYTSIVVFGDSLSDTGNVSHLTGAKYGLRIPGAAADYQDGRFTDGTDTVPAAHNYNGVWVEQLAALLPNKPAIKNSLDGGTDYAYGFATTNDGTSTFTFGPGNVFSVNVNNIGQQITDYLATTPKINNKTLFVVWGGANDLINATSPGDIGAAAINEVANIQRLIDAGATQFLVPNLPPLGLTPRFNGSSMASTPATKAAALFNLRLDVGLQLLRYLNPGKSLQLSELDVYTLFKKVVAKPSNFAMTNVTGKSQGNYLVNPDTYLFWDDLHPTTHGHNILALKAAEVLAESTSGSATVSGRELVTAP